MESLVLVKILLLIAALISFGYLAISLAKRGAFSSLKEQNCLIRVIEYKRLDSKCSLSLVKAGDEHFFIATNQNSISIKAIKIGNNETHNID